MDMEGLLGFTCGQKYESTCKLNEKLMAVLLDFELTSK